MTSVATEVLNKGQEKCLEQSRAEQSGQLLEWDETSPPPRLIGR